MTDEKRREDELEDKSQTAAGEGMAGGADPAAEEAAAVTSGDEPVDAEEDRHVVDAANPEVIARRVAALGEEDDAERLAREEERKLAERRAGNKPARKKKSGLEVAASKKLSQIGQRAEPKRALATAADADPLIARTEKLSEWARKNQKVVQIVGGLLVVGLVGFAGFLWHDHTRETEASATLTKAVDTQKAPIGEPKKDDEGEEDDKPSFKTFDDRRSASLKQYREVQSKFAGTGAAILARLAEGSLLLDGRDADGALAAFNDVKGSPLAAADNEVKGRALEGIGFAYELKAAVTPAEKDKYLDLALGAFKELENSVDVKGFKETAMYHQSRVLLGKGEKDKAKELLLSLKERLNKAEEAIAPGLPPPPSFPYLKTMAMDRLHEIDPTSQPKPHAGGGGGGANQFSPEQLRRLMEQAKQKGGGH